MKKESIPLLFIYSCIPVLIFIHLQPIKYLATSFVIDDALYYLEVARNIISGNGVTYDNHTYTNGFHPLWGAICVFISFIIGTESSSLLRAAMIVQSLFLMIGLVCLWKIAKETKMKIFGTVIAMIIMFFSRFDLWHSTMESSSLMLFLLLLLVFSLRKDLLRSEKISENVFLGVLLAFVFLARLDTIFIVIAFLLVQLFIKKRKLFHLANLKSTIITGTVFTLLAAPYLFANMTFFGSIVPVSGIKKMNGTRCL